MCFLQKWMASGCIYVQGFWQRAVGDCEEEPVDAATKKTRKCHYVSSDDTCMLYKYINIYSYLSLSLSWVNYNDSLNRIRSQWGRYHLVRYIHFYILFAGYDTVVCHKCLYVSSMWYSIQCISHVYLDIRILYLHVVWIT